MNFVIIKLQTLDENIIRIPSRMIRNLFVIFIFWANGVFFILAKM